MANAILFMLCPLLHTVTCTPQCETGTTCELDSFAQLRVKAKISDASRSSDKAKGFGPADSEHSVVDSTIPKILYMTGPWEPAGLMAENRKNMGANLEVRFFNDSAMDASAFNISQKLQRAGVVDDAYAALTKLRPMAYRADLWRLMVLWDTGGIYMDAKVKLLRSIESIFNMSSGLLNVCQDESPSPAPWGTPVYWNGFMAAPAKCAALEASIKRVVNNIMMHYYAPEVDPEYANLYITGPGALSRALFESKMVPVGACEWKHGEDKSLYLLKHFKFSGGTVPVKVAKVDESIHKSMHQKETFYGTLFRNRGVYCNEYDLAGMKYNGPPCKGEPSF